jgi:hypothetical protein
MMLYLLYGFFTLNALLTLVLGRRPITLDKTKHVQYRLLGALEATVYPVTLAVMFAVALWLQAPLDPDRTQAFFAEHAATFRYTRIGILAVYLIISVVWEKAIRNRIAAQRTA